MNNLQQFFNDICCDDFCSFEEVNKEKLQNALSAMEKFRETSSSIRFNHATIAKHFTFQDYDLLGTDTENDTHKKLTKLSQDIIKAFEPGGEYSTFLDIEVSVSEDDIWGAAGLDEIEDVDEYLERIQYTFENWEDEGILQYAIKNSGDCYEPSVQSRMIKKFLECDGWYEDSNIHRFTIHMCEALQIAYYRDCEERGLNGDKYCVQPFFTNPDLDFRDVLLGEEVEDLFLLA